MLDPVKSETERIDAVTGAERNQGAVVNCRFDPTLHGRGLILRGDSRQFRFDPHRF
jgi:hypothetical protein